LSREINLGCRWAINDPKEKTLFPGAERGELRFCLRFADSKGGLSAVVSAKGLTGEGGCSGKSKGKLKRVWKARENPGLIWERKGPATMTSYRGLRHKGNPKQRDCEFVKRG